MENYYDRTDPAKHYDRHLFRAGKGLQSAELNEVQSATISRITSIGDALLKDGDIIKDCACLVNADTGAVLLNSGAIYIRGMVRGVGTGSFTIATVGTVTIGVYITETEVTELDDPALRDPAVGTRNYQEAGAGRLQVETAWGYAGDDSDGDFFPVWTVIDGVLLPKEAPPNLDSVTNAIAAYDRQSTGGTYVVSGLRVSALADLVSGEQVYSVGEGEARVDGRNVKLSTSRRVVYPATADLLRITSEPHVSSGVSAQRVNTDRYPIANLVSVQITAEKTATITHGAFTGAQDSLPDNSVLAILEVKQGATTYVVNTDYKLTAGKVDWTPSGAEPAPGSTYTVKYQYITTVTPTAADAAGFTVTGAVSGTLIQVTYDAALPRYDRLCLDSSGQFVWVKGVAADYYPVAPSVPNNLMLLGTIAQTWDATATRSVRNDGVRMVPMADIEDIRMGVLDLYDLVAEQKLKSDANGRLAAATKGLFVDPFRSNAQRDEGITQSAVTAFGFMVMPMSESVASLTTPGGTVATLNKTDVAKLTQDARSGSMKVNPYMAFAPFPASVTLNPAVDHAVQEIINWAPGIFINHWLGPLGHFVIDSIVVSIETLSSTTTALPNLRQINVAFSISGFGPGEQVTQVKFDGIDVTSTVAGV
jgi:hypothetical protein